MTSSSTSSLNDTFLTPDEKELPLLLDNQQLSQIAQLVFREDSINPKIRLNVYEYILNEGQLTNTASAIDDDDDETDEGNNNKSSASSFTSVYAKHKNSVRGFNEEIDSLFKKIFSSSSSFPITSTADNADIDEEAEQKIHDELCGLCEHLASRLDLTGQGASGFLVSTVAAMYSAVVANLKEPRSPESAKTLQKTWPNTVFKLSFQFAQKHKYTLAMKESALSVTTSSPTSNNNNNNSNSNKNRKDVALILLRLILQYHLPELMRHCDQYQMPLCDWVLDSWILPQMLKIFFLCPSKTSKTTTNAMADTVLTFFDFIIAARDPLIMFALALEILMTNLKDLIQIDNKDKFKEAFDDATFSSSFIQKVFVDKTTSPRSVMLHAQQLLRSTPRCAKNRLRHYFHGTKLLYPLPTNNNNETTTNNSDQQQQQQQNAQASSSSTSMILFDERSLYESQVVLPVSNTELVEAFAISTTVTHSINDSPNSKTESVVVLEQQQQNNSNKKVAGNKNDSDFDHHLRPLSFVILDCRSEKSFHFARLPTAIHIGADVGYDPELMQSMIERFEGARGSHMCVLGTGRGVQEEANLLKIIALRFVQAGFPYVSIAEDGFKGLIPMIKAGRVEVVKSQQQILSQQQQQTQQQQQKRSSSSSENNTNNKKSLSSDEILKKAEETAKEAKEAAAKWGKSIMSKFSGWSIGGGSKKSEISSSATTDNSTVQNKKDNESSDDTNKNQQSTNENNNGKQQDEIVDDNNDDGSNPNTQSTFKAGGNDDFENDEDDDELLSELVTTVAEPKKEHTNNNNVESATKVENNTANDDEKKTPEKTETTTGASEASPHPFDELFGDDDD